MIDIVTKNINGCDAVSYSVFIKNASFLSKLGSCFPEYDGNLYLSRKKSYNYSVFKFYNAQKLEKSRMFFN